MCASVQIEYCASPTIALGANRVYVCLCETRQQKRRKVKNIQPNKGAKLKANR